MQTQNKISVIIITGNEENNIRECLESVKWADEVIVVDSESSDSTVKIAAEYTDKVFARRWEGFAAQKTYALSLAGNEWVLSLDADERVKKELAEEILKKDLSECDAYYIHRENYFLGRLITGCGWGTDYQLRLFKKSGTSLSERLVHEGFQVAGKKGKLKNSMEHYSYRNLEDGLGKINKYSSLEAKEKSGRKKVTITSITLKPVLAFLQHYIFRKGFKDGRYGLMVSLMHAMTKLQVQMKIWEIKKTEHGE